MLAAGVERLLEGGAADALEERLAEDVLADPAHRAQGLVDQHDALVGVEHQHALAHAVEDAGEEVALAVDALQGPRVLAREAVEGAAEIGELVVAAHGRAGVEVPGGHGAGGKREGTDRAGEEEDGHGPGSDGRAGRGARGEGERIRLRREPLGDGEPHEQDEHHRGRDEAHRRHGARARAPVAFVRAGPRRGPLAKGHRWGGLESGADLLSSVGSARNR